MQGKKSWLITKLNDTFDLFPSTPPDNRGGMSRLSKAQDRTRQRLEMLSRDPILMPKSVDTQKMAMVGAHQCHH